MQRAGSIIMARFTQTRLTAKNHVAAVLPVRKLIAIITVLIFGLITNISTSSAYLIQTQS